MLYIIMEYRSTAAIIAVVVLTIGISFCISMASHSTYVWFMEKSQANKDLPVVLSERNNNKTKIVNGELTNQSELSTLV
ncbi:hypothetical protein LSH36_722g01007 [Paralvinella palmiformis]|uniref:Uncharacterized protein n=1 Tax=Paralvinella palmiformis TaxID=53620 RepID=A0AAD9J1E9_9ANNE|nr:hypothetical protein LSH36_722g01007 [Paralvinella palmiformis]